MWVGEEGSWRRRGAHHQGEGSTGSATTAAGSQGVLWHHLSGWPLLGVLLLSSLRCPHQWDEEENEEG